MVNPTFDPAMIKVADRHIGNLFLLWKGAFLTFVVCFGNSALAQQTFTFNSPGNVCYFRYTCFAQDGDYVGTRRPFVIVVGKPGQSSEQAFKEDSLKNSYQFYKHLFVYVPASDNPMINKLGCINAITSLVSHGFEFGNRNLFLSVQDTSVTYDDVTKAGIADLFHSVHLDRNGKQVMQGDSIVTLTDAFRASAISYESAEEKEESRYGSFYIDEDVPESPESSGENPYSVKTYFGPPSSKNYTLTGLVRDKVTGETLPFAIVAIRGSRQVTSTNADGFFTLAKVPTDTAVLVINYVGYDKAEVYLSPSLPKKNFSVELRQSVQKLQAFTIYGDREDVVLSEKLSVSTVKMTPKKIEKLPALGEKDIMRSLQLMPGVSAANESSSGLYVRGGTPDQNLVLLDGFTIYHVDHLYGFFSAFNANAIKDIQLFKGGFESKFGGRLSSVTELTGKDGNKKFNLGGDLSMLSFNVFTEIPVGEKFSSVLAVRRSYKGFIYNKIFDKFNTSGSSQAPAMGPGGRQMQQTEPVSYFYDLNGKFTYRPGKSSLITWSIYNGTDHLDNSNTLSAQGFGGGRGFGQNSTDLTNYGNLGTSLRFSNRWGSRLYSNTILSYSNYYSKRDRTQERTVISSSGESTTSKTGVIENNNLKDLTLKSDYQFDLSKDNQLQFGFWNSRLHSKYTYSQNDTSTVLDKNDYGTLRGMYLQDEIKLFGMRMDALPGIRVTWFDHTAKWYTEPRFKVSLAITDRIRWNSAWGKYYQFMNRVTREDILSGSRDFWVLSDNSHVPVSSAFHYISGFQYETHHYLFSTELYYKTLSDLTEYSLRITPGQGGVSYNENFFTGSSVAKGIEFLVQKKSGKLNGWVSYTLAYADNRFKAYSDTWYPANQDVRNEFKSVAMYTYRRWDFSATWIYASGRPYTAPSGAYVITLLDGTEQTYFTVTSKNSLRLPDYHRMDIAATYKLLKGSKGTRKRLEIGSLSFSVFNLYNRKNVWYKQYTISGDEILETNVNYIGFMPNVTLSLKIR